MAPTDHSNATDTRFDLSIVIITLNEEKHLENCLQSLPRGSEVVVLDSGSTDRTEAIARAFGARFETRAFTNHSEQKNAAVAFATRNWIFSIDADEVLSPELAAEVVKVVHRNGETSGYKVKRRLVFMGHTMRFGKTTDWPLRLFRKAQGRFENEIHERVKIKDGKVGCLSGEMAHYSYDDLKAYFERFNLYTTRIAEQHYRRGKNMPFGPLHVLRPWTEFLVRYFFRLGFLDGYPGYSYALLSSVYTFVKYSKLRELLQAKGR